MGRIKLGKIDMGKLSIKRIRKLAGKEKPKAIARYLRQFLPPEKRSPMEVKLDEFAHKLINDAHVYNKREILKKLEEMSR